MILQRLQQFDRHLSQVLQAIAGAFLVAMVVLACANMISRTVAVPVKGTFELMGFAGAISTAFALAATQRHKGHITVTLVSGKLPPVVEKLLLILAQTASLVFFVIVAWQSLVWAGKIYASGEVSETLHLSYYPCVFAVAFGFAALVLSLICDLLTTLLQPAARGAS